MGIMALLIAVGVVAMSDLATRPTARAVPVGLAPVAVAVDEHTHQAFVANYGDASLSVLDARSGAQMATIAVPPLPSLPAIAPAAGRLFVAADTTDAAGHTIMTVRGTANGQRLRTVAVGAGASAIAVQQPTGHVFVADEADNSVSILDARSGRILRTARVGIAPLALAVNERTGRLVVANNGDNSVSVLDTATGRVVRTVAVGADPLRRAGRWALHHGLLLQRPLSAGASFNDAMTSDDVRFTADLAASRSWRTGRTAADIYAAFAESVGALA
jgi:YVTN family beta-propeller protein